MADEQLSGINFEKLGSDKYNSWKFSMKMYLEGKDVWEIAYGSETQPPEADNDGRVKFKKRVNLVMAAIFVGV